MKTKIKALELVGFTIWIIGSLLFTVILCQYILPENFKANNMLKELVEVRGFFKRVSAVLMASILLVALGVGVYMFAIEADPSDFTNFQGNLTLADKRTKYRNVSMKSNIESIEEIYDIPINVVNNLLFQDIQYDKRHNKAD